MACPHSPAGPPVQRRPPALRTGRSVLGRGLAVLTAFSREQPELTLAAVQHAISLPSATTHRLVTELVGWGAPERIGRGRYRIGLRRWQLGSLAPQARNLREVALPFLQDLLDATRTGSVIAVISVVVPTGRRPFEQLVPAVRMAAAGIDRGMRPYAPHQTHRAPGALVGSGSFTRGDVNAVSRSHAVGGQDLQRRLDRRVRR